MAKQLISSSETKCVYRDGDLAIKEFCEGFPKAEVLNEALCTARVEDLPGLHVPKVLSVSVMDGKWSITREFIEGKTLQQLMDENPDKVQEYMEQMVDLQIDIHSKACPLLNKLKEKMCIRDSRLPIPPPSANSESAWSSRPTRHRRPDRS